VSQLDLLSGPHLRDEGTNRVLAHEATLWRTQAFAAVEVLARLCAAGERETFTAEDVRAVVGDPPHHANSFGAVFLKAARRGDIVGVGWTRSTRREAHACRLQVYTAGEKA
jgi:hypothetical protein